VGLVFYTYYIQTALSATPRLVARAEFDERGNLANFSPGSMTLS
jgi:hypothetical protein